jgi:hypothetical protein
VTRDTARQQVRDVSRRPARMVKAYLAETYDGIGQVVKVAMTRGGVTNAINARIAAGDFGGGRTFPEGTPVMVMSAHGQLEVFLGNIPQPCIFLDDCDRVGSDPGIASHGELWGYSGPGIGYVVPSTNGAELQFDFDLTNRSAYQYFDASVPGQIVPDLMKTADAFSFRAKFKQTALISSGTDIIRFVWYGPGFVEELRIHVSFGVGTTFLRISTQFILSANTAVPNIEVDTWYVIHIDCKPGVYARMQLYKEDDGPGDWQVDVDDGAPVIDLTNSPLWDFSNELQNGLVMTRYFDYLKFCQPLEP